MSSPNPNAVVAPLLSERELVKWYGTNTDAAVAPGVAQHAIWQTLGEARLELDLIEGEAIEFYERRLLLLVGTLCLRNGQRALWSTIWSAAQTGSRVQVGEELDFLEEATAQARAGEL